MEGLTAKTPQLKHSHMTLEEERKKF